MPQEEKKPLENRHVTTDDAIRMLRAKGIELSEKEAENVLELMYFLAKLIVNQNLKK